LADSVMKLMVSLEPSPMRQKCGTLSGAAQANRQSFSITENQDPFGAAYLDRLANCLPLVRRQKLLSKLGDETRAENMCGESRALSGHKDKIHDLGHS
jgi:hypothetical protein